MLRYKSGAILEGSWKKDKVEGEAKLTLANGDFYKGCWSGSHKNGFGRYQF